MKLDPHFTHDDYFALARAPAWLLVTIVALLFVLGSSVSPQEDNSGEFIRADLMNLDHRDDAYRQKAIKDCIAKSGPGVAPKFDANDVVTGCMPRKGKS